MGTNPCTVLLQLSIVAYLLTCTQGRLSRKSFPPDFLFGTASSAYQYEGATNVDGKRASIWDTFTRTHPEKIVDHSSGAIADGFYYHYKDDIALIKDNGFDSLRFSISWPRVIPGGRISEGVNQAGVLFYNNLIDELLSNGVQPLVTLFHWDLPQALEDKYGGFLSPNIVNDYRDYVDFCFKEFGDRVKHWITFNEPNIFSIGGYEIGIRAPGRCSSYKGNCSFGNSGTEPYIVVHHMLLAHADAVKLYQEKYKVSQQGIIGITINAHWIMPKLETKESIMAASRALDFSFGWIADPIMFGNYPETMRLLVGNRLPKFTDEQSRLLKGSIDFIGLNYYTARFAEDAFTRSSSIEVSYSTDNHVNLTAEKDGIPIGEPTALNWLYIYPAGIKDLTLYIKRKYKNPPIFITENGVVDSNASALLRDALDDGLRIKYHYDHLSNLLEAIKAGANVRRYYAWSFLDNFEWESGYTIRFGITYVDYKNKLQRHLKKSALWFKEFLQKDYFTKPKPSLLYSE